MMTDKPDLLPCVFCGGNDLVLVSGDRDYAHIKCTRCLAKGPFVDQVGNWKRPYNAWNTRPAMVNTNGESE